MPQPYRPGGRSYPGKGFSLRQAAGDGLLILVRCSSCRRLTRFLASDLMEIFGPDRDARDPPFPCSRCGHGEWVTVKFHLPFAGDYGHLVVRRPAGVVRVQKWKSVKLGD